jgi:type II secretory pathway component HofQ
VTPDHAGRHVILDRTLIKILLAKRRSGFMDNTKHVKTQVLVENGGTVVTVVFSN